MYGAYGVYPSGIFSSPGPFNPETEGWLPEWAFAETRGAVIRGPNAAAIIRGGTITSAAPTTPEVAVPGGAQLPAVFPQNPKKAPWSGYGIAMGAEGKYRMKKALFLGLMLLVSLMLIPIAGRSVSQSKAKARKKR